MKIERKRAEFQPVTITLESVKEVALLRAALAKAGGGHEGDMLYNIYCLLEDISPKDEHYVPTDDSYGIRIGEV